MWEFRLYLQIFLFLDLQLFINGNIMYFTPNHPLCPGDTVRMVCLIQVPPNSSFNGVFDAAQISFNGSESTFPEILDLLTDVDTSRYVGGTEGLNVSASNPGAFLDISYLPVDSTITFGCHAFLENLQSTEALVTGMMMRPAIKPSTPSSTVSLLDPTSCSLTEISWEPVSSERDVTSYYVYRNGELLSDQPTAGYTDRTRLVLNRTYKYSVVASSCAGNSSMGYTRTVIVGAYSIPDNSVQLKHNSDKEILEIYWSLSNTVSSAPNLVLTYLIQINATYIQDNGDEIQEEDSVTFSQTSTKTYFETTLSVPILDTLQDPSPNIISADIKILRQCGQFGGSLQSTTAASTSVTNPITTFPTNEPTVKESNSANSTTTSLLFTLMLTLFVFLSVL